MTRNEERNRIIKNRYEHKTKQIQVEHNNTKKYAIQYYISHFIKSQNQKIYIYHIHICQPTTPSCMFTYS